MPLFKAIIIIDKTSNDSSIAHHVEMDFFASDIQYAEPMINEYITNIFPGMVLDTLYETGYSNSDQTDTKSEQKES